MDLTAENAKNAREAPSTDLPEPRLSPRMDLTAKNAENAERRRALTGNQRGIGGMVGDAAMIFLARLRRANPFIPPIPKHLHISF
jgi:hypothetical protein